MEIRSISGILEDLRIFGIYFFVAGRGVGTLWVGGPVGVFEKRFRIELNFLGGNF